VTGAEIAASLLLTWEGGLPVNPVKFARECNIEVLYKEITKDAVGYFDREAKTIFVDPEQPEWQQRFSVARSLGFALTGNDEEAISFALELLMPENAIRELAARQRLNTMAYYFDVSRQVLFVRMKRLDLIK